MMISQKDWQSYINQLASVNRAAALKMQQYIDRAGYQITPELLQYAHRITMTYGEASAELACQMYDTIAIAQGAGVPAAEPANVASFEEMRDEIRRSYQHSQFETPAVVERLVKLAAADTTLQNAARDGAQFAWIPSADGCAFCRTIASRGWRNASKKTIKGEHADHIHQHCRCNFVVRFNSFLKVQGYDPDKLLAEYENAEGGKWDDKINSMRREDYAVRKDAINAQKRAAYKRLMDSRKNVN